MAPKSRSHSAALAEALPKAPAAKSKALQPVVSSPLGLVNPAPIYVQTPAFEGPLETLFLCVRDKKVNLSDIPLAPVCEAYWIYVVNSPMTGLDEAAAALVALAYLLERKAWMLLPTPEPEPEAAELGERLPASVHEFELAMEALRVGAEEREKLFFRSPGTGPDLYELPYKLESVTPGDLALAFERILNRLPAEPKIPTIRARKSLADFISAALMAISDTWKPLDLILPLDTTRSDAVYWFLAVLELIRLGQVAVRLDQTEVEFRRADAENPLAQ